MEHTFTLMQNGQRRSVVAFFPDKENPIQQATSESHPHFDSIVKGLQDGDPNVYDLFDVEAGMKRKFEQLSDRISVRNGKVYRDLVEVDSTVADHVVRFLEEGVDDYKPLVAFMERIEANPSQHSKDHLYTWLRGSGNYTITDEGKIVAYKGVKTENGKYFSIHSGPAVVDGEAVNGYVPNEPGSVVQMPRDQVTSNPNVHCAKGLHVGDWSYAKDFSQGAVLEVEVDPADVVSVPNDASCKKMRVWRYKVVGLRDAAYNGPVRTYEDFYDDDYEDDPDYPDHW